MKYYRVALAFILTVMLVACGDSGPGGPDGGDGGIDGCQGAGEKLLSVVGNPNRILHPGEQTDLSVALLEKCVGAVAGETVTFTILQNPGLASLSSSSAVTAATGMAQVTLIIAPGEILGDKLFQVHATHPSDPEGVYFSITVKPAVTELYVYGSDKLECFVGESLELKVQVKDTYTGTPARGMEVKFSLNNPPAGADAKIPVPVVATNASGIATTLFQCGTLATKYQVVAEGNGTNIGTKNFEITVKNRKACTKDEDCDPGFKCISGQCRQSGGESCATNDDCPAGFECIGFQCVPEGSLPTSCNSSADCPTGYYCQGHECFPCPEVSNIPECQQGGDQCTKDSDCPPGFVCQNGVCVPQNPQGVDIPELGGKWYTRHFFDTSNALGGATVAGIIDRLNRAINYCDITGIGLIDDLLCDFIKQYIPPWAGTLIDIFANLVNMLKELRAEGVMQVTHLNPRELISATSGPTFPTAPPSTSPAISSRWARWALRSSPLPARFRWTLPPARPDTL
jgi:Cys-rich repeat protein